MVRDIALSNHFPEVQDLSVCVVLPAYHAAKTLQATLDRMPSGACQDIILVDDASTDDTTEVARQLGIRVHRHAQNRGYGGNQKTCYRLALETKADVIVMLHPDNEYDGALVPYMVGFIKADVVDIVLGSRISRREEVLAGGMPLIKYLANRVLTIMENVVLGLNLPDTTPDIVRIIDACSRRSTSKRAPMTSCSISSSSCRPACTGSAPVPCLFRRITVPSRAVSRSAAARSTHSERLRRSAGICCTAPGGNRNRCSAAGPPLSHPPCRALPGRRRLHSDRPNATRNAKVRFMRKLAYTRAAIMTSVSDSMRNADIPQKTPRSGGRSDAPARFQAPAIWPSIESHK